MLNYEELTPALPLQDYIECYWKLSSETALEEELCLPDGSASFIFNFGSSYFRSVCHKTDIRTEVSRLSLPHQGKDSILVNQALPVELIGVRFKPYGLAPFFNISMLDYSPPFILFENDMKDWIAGFEEVWLADSFSQRLMIIEKALMEQSMQASKVDELVLKAFTAMVRNSGNIKIGELLDQLCVSKSNLEKKFQEHIGLSPKILCNILRINGIVYDQQQDPSFSLTELSYKQGFFDQSHLVHNFRSFTGLPPGKFFKQNYRLVEMLKQSFASRKSEIY